MGEFRGSLDGLPEGYGVVFGCYMKDFKGFYTGGERGCVRVCSPNDRDSSGLVDLVDAAFVGSCGHMVIL